MAQVVDLTSLLQAAQSADANARQAAEQGIKQFESQPESYLLSLSSHLANESNAVDTRRLAGLILKNALDAREETSKTALTNRWLGISDPVKQQIKAALLSTLGSEVQDVGHTAALVIAKVAAIEIPRNTWPDLIPSLLNNSSAPSAKLRRATLEALGYVCEELGAFEEDYLAQEQVNAILTAVVAGMRPEETDMELRIAATTALNNALEFAHTNFSNDQERNYLMQMVCHGTQASDVRVRRASWECLVRIAAAYYHTLPVYMQEIFKLTQQAVRGDEEEVVLQALEFWSTVAEEEVDRIAASADSGDSHGDDNIDTVNHKFISAALPHLVPMLLEQLTKQEEGADSDDGAWNPALAAGTALGLSAMAVGDAIVGLVMPFVQEHIQRNTGNPEDWRAREAATFAFGSILEGPSVEKLAELARSGLGFLLAALKDPNPQVRNTTAWTLGRIFECVGEEEISPPLLDSQSVAPVVGALLEAIRDETHIAEKVCYAISKLAGMFRDSQGPSPLSAYFENLVGALLETASRPVEAGDLVRLQMQAYEAINSVVENSSLEAAPLVAQLLPVGVAKLMEATAQPPTTADTSEAQAEVQGLLCGVLQVVLQKLNEGGDDVRKLAAPHADAVMQALLRVLTWRANTIHEGALLAVGALTYTAGRDFAKYLEAFYPVLEQGLQQYQMTEICQFSVTVIGDICRAVEEQIFPYCDRLMTLLLTNLQNNEVHRNIKPMILTTFGDIAMAVGDRFEVYLAHVIQMLQSAAQLCVDLAANAAEDDDDEITYINSLRQGILEAWSGLFNGLSKQRVDQYLRQCAPSLIEFIEHTVNDRKSRERGVWRTAAALLGDMAMNLSGVGPLFRQKPFIKPFLHECALNYDKNTSSWALEKVQAAENAPIPA